MMQNDISIALIKGKGPDDNLSITIELDLLLNDINFLMFKYVCMLKRSQQLQTLKTSGIRSKSRVSTTARVFALLQRFLLPV